MVRQGDFEISIVLADTKVSFKEHTKDGKVYVEVEPDEEYFICMTRVGNAVQGTLLATASVDEKSLGYHTKFPSISRPYYAGLWTLKNGTLTQTALMFTKPRPTQEGGKQSQLLMGKVEVAIYKGILDGYKESCSDNVVKSTWEASTIDLAQAGGLAEKKALRSGEGSMSLTVEKATGQVATYKYGEKVDVFTLNYCTAVGLIQVGVLPKPPLWVYHRMLHPAKKHSTTVTASILPDIPLDDLSNLKIEE